MKKLLNIVLVLIVGILIFSSCNTPTPTPTKVPTEISTDVKVKPPTRTPTPTVTKTPTLIPTLTPTLIPTGESECIQVVFSDGITIFVCKP